ncbi:DUF2550 domain-containing protein [Microlunatus panaciterrae]|uniref:DUF2550 domain-containing protein n=1 Tax=Microlunatus panaciterrae TaxID=400768 RepID=A0ABS2REG3_9ACTN|nr:DUF2550 domain-containing protein [Microlunatus panaciterrae]MBM7797391.1 hypothetical protein [Microlunatus panaciterrae]
MGEWFGLVEIVVIVLVLLILPLVLLALRRRWLARMGGTFECSLRLRKSTPGTGWVLGVARYNGEDLEWFRFFSFSFRPRKTFVRGQVMVLENRDPDPVEAVSLYSGQRVVRVEEGYGDDAQLWDLAMSGDSLTGMLSWLEAAPPGVGGY